MRLHFPDATWRQITPKTCPVYAITHQTTFFSPVKGEAECVGHPELRADGCAKSNARNNSG